MWYIIAYKCLIAPAPFAEKSTFSLLSHFCTIFKNQLGILCGSSSYGEQNKFCSIDLCVCISTNPTALITLCNESWKQPDEFLLHHFSFSKLFFICFSCFAFQYKFRIIKEILLLFFFFLNKLSWTHSSVWKNQHLLC